MKLTFLGAGHEVTGSRTLLEAAGYRILIDYGMEQGKDLFANPELPLAAGEIDCGHDEGFVHGEDHASVSNDASLVSESFGECLTETDPYILCGMVCVDLHIPRTSYEKIKSAVRCEKREHVIEKSAARINYACALSVKVQAKLYIGFRCLAYYFRVSHLIPSKMNVIALTSSSICSFEPTVIRL